MKLSGTTYIITGAGGAVAGAINQVFLQAGATLILADRDGAAQRAAERLGAGTPFVADLETLEGAQAMVAAALAQTGRLDGVVHTVGGFAFGKLLDRPPAASVELFEQMFNLNLRTLVNTVAAALPEVHKNGGFIGGIAAGQAARGLGPNVSFYAAAKAAVAVFLKSVEAELSVGGNHGDYSTKIGVVYPMGAIDTPANRRDMPQSDPNTWIDPFEIANAFLTMATRSERGRITEWMVHPPR
jgi:NAD(P)-dependent dehydrogenase (short-subunit alcohol dehydrogenase family)